MSSSKPEETVDRKIHLDDVRLKIGETVQLQTVADRDSQRYYVKLLGYAKGRSFMVTTPIQDGGYLLLREGQNFVVRMFAGKSVFAFPASIIKVANTPYPYLHLKYPEEVLMRAIRKAERVDVRLIAAVVPAGSSGEQPRAVTIDNLSLGGAALSAKAPVGEVGAEIELRFKLELDGFARVVSLPAVIRACGQVEGQEAMFNIGVQFKDVDPQDSLLLSGYIYRRLVETAA
jgi:c-di-GMP-binding flagellar brake protein YcgR